MANMIDIEEQIEKIKKIDDKARHIIKYAKFFKLPILVGFEEEKQLKVWCPYCKCFHHHSNKERNGAERTLLERRRTNHCVPIYYARGAIEEGISPLDEYYILTTKELEGLGD